MGKKNDLPKEEGNDLPKEEGREGGEKNDVRSAPAGPGARTQDLPRAIGEGSQLHTMGVV